VRVLAAVVAVAEGHPAVVEVEDAVVGDGNAIDVAPEVADEVLRGVEGGLGMDDAVVAVQADQQLLPVAVVGQLGRAAGEGADGAQVLQGAQEDGAEHRREGERGEEEVLRGRDGGLGLPATGYLILSDAVARREISKLSPELMAQVPDGTIGPPGIDLVLTSPLKRSWTAWAALAWATSNTPFARSESMS
jgi:hypothetical protein